MYSPPLSREETQKTPSEDQEMVFGQMSNKSIIMEKLYNCVQDVDGQVHKKELVPGPLSQERTQEKYGCAAESACKSENGEFKPYDQTVTFEDSVKNAYVTQNGMDYFSRCKDAEVWRKDQQNSHPICFQVFDYDNSASRGMKLSNLKSCHKILMLIAITLLRFLPPVCITICINNRRITRAILEVCGVPDSEIERVRLVLDRYWASQLLEDATYSSSSRRYRRKYSWMVCSEHLEAILRSSVIIRRIKKYLDLSGNWSKFSESLQKHSELRDKPEVIDAVEELKNTVEMYDDVARSDNLKIVVDLSLTRELPYYTTSVFEVYVQHMNSDGLNSSFIAGGGCYDISVGGGLQLFAVGFSVFLPIVMSIRPQSCLPSISRLMPPTCDKELCIESPPTLGDCLKNQAGDFDDHQRGLDQPPNQVSRDSRGDHERAEFVLLN